MKAPDTNYVGVSEQHTTHQRRSPGAIHFVRRRVGRRGHGLGERRRAMACGASELDDPTQAHGLLMLDGVGVVRKVFAGRDRKAAALARNALQLKLVDFPLRQQRHRVANARGR
eukprot:999139-Rhodomonas_salina.1